MADFITDSYLVVAAIDFGTTYSGYAYSFRDEFLKDPSYIHSNKPWIAGGAGLLSLKTPTCLLLNSDRQFVAFGYEAENRYAELVDEEEHIDYYYFTRFKMCLHKNKNISKDLMINDVSGKKSMLALDVFSLSIQALKDHLVETLSMQIKDLHIDDILWVLTVPAMWSDRAKQFMRMSAEQAGIDPEKLRIALEPEAASIYCQHIPVEISNEQSRCDVMSTGVKYAVVDVGGGTADITVHEKTNDGNLKEVCCTCGNGHGGTSVDQEFLQFIEEIIGPRAMERLKSEDFLETYLDIVREFESKKRTIRQDHRSHVLLTFPISVVDLICKEDLGKSFTDALCASKFANDVTIKNGKLKFGIDRFMAFFNDTVYKIVLLLSQMLKKENADGVSHIVLVGGFSACILLQDALKKTFPEQTLIVPLNSEIAVLKGAVIFGHNPKIICERISRFTYGFSKRKRFDSSIHDESHLELIKGQEKCCKVFEPIVFKHEKIPLGKKITSTAKSKSDNNKYFTFRLYQSESVNPKYTDEEGCSLVGEIKVQKVDQEAVELIKVVLTFGDTEINVKIVEKEHSTETRGVIELI